MCKWKTFLLNFFGLSVEIGKEGIVNYHPLPKLDAYEQKQYDEMLPVLKANIETGKKFVHG